MLPHPFPIPLSEDNTSSFNADYQLLCNPVDGKTFNLPLIPGGSLKYDRQPVDPEYLKTVDPKKVIIFQYENGPVDFNSLFSQIQAAHLSTQEIINVVTAADVDGPFSTDTIFELKDDLHRTMSHNKPLMTWVEKHPSKPPEGWPEKTPPSPAPAG